MKRIQALRAIDMAYADRPLVVTCGATARELASVGKRDNHLYLLDSMGAAGAVGLGLALADRGPLAAIEGDGSLLMGCSVLPSIAYLQPRGFVLIVLDNHVHASADSFATQSERVSLAAMCRGAGLQTLESASDNVLADRLREARRASGSEPVALVVEIEPGNEPEVALLLDDPVLIKDRFLKAMEAMS
jgi:thiamine pyrophosphate-dependent acetolactate synthase large subunit-like protein